MSHPSLALRNYLRLLTSRHYLPFAAASAFAVGGFFGYLAGSSFVFISVHGLSPIAYSAVIAANALGLMTGAQIAPWLMGRFRPQVIVRAALSVYAAAALALAALELTGGASLVSLTILLFVVVAAMAFVLPLGSVMALDAYGAISGTAAALSGALNFGAGTLASLVVGAAANGTALPMVLVIAASGSVACLIAFFVFPNPPCAAVEESAA